MNCAPCRDVQLHKHVFTVFICFAFLRPPASLFPDPSLLQVDRASGGIGIFPQYVQQAKSRRKAAFGVPKREFLEVGRGLGVEELEGESTIERHSAVVSLSCCLQRCLHLVFGAFVCGVCLLQHLNLKFVVACLCREMDWID